jgi:hypothetical protein
VVDCAEGRAREEIMGTIYPADWIDGGVAPRGGCRRIDAALAHLAGALGNVVFTRLLDGNLGMRPIMDP